LIKIHAHLCKLAVDTLTPNGSSSATARPNHKANSQTIDC